MLENEDDELRYSKQWSLPIDLERALADHILYRTLYEEIQRYDRRPTPVSDGESPLYSSATASSVAESDRRVESLTNSEDNKEAVA